MYEVVTVDGYILSLYRIPCGKNEPRDSCNTYGAFATNPELAQKIKANFALGPVVTTKYLMGAFRTVAYIDPALIKTPVSDRDEISFIVYCLCYTKCSPFIFPDYSISPGYRFSKHPVSRIDVYTGHLPEGTSVRSIIHFSQNYDVMMSIQWSCLNFIYVVLILEGFHYNQSTPPIYKVEDMKIQTFIWSGRQDILANPIDVKNLESKTYNLVYHEKINDYNHMDFIIGNDSPGLDYIQTTNLLQGFELLKFFLCSAFPSSVEVLLKFFLCSAFPSSAVLCLDPCRAVDVSEIVIKWGYPNEEYEVVTDDGYILPINRIPHGKNNINSSAPKMVVYCQHGLFSTPGVWVANPPDNSLGFILADAGYDVWLGHSRGSTWAKKHKYLDPNSKQFWAFSYDEMIKYDLPATINFILKKTGQKQIFYVGHSQGTLIALGAFSTNQQLAEKVNKSFLLAPVATVKYIKGSGRLPSYFTPTAFKLLFDNVCPVILASLGGYAPDQLNKSRIDVYITHSLAGTSVQILLHYGQMKRRHRPQMKTTNLLQGVFQAYDWGSLSLNMLHYNQTTPPLYNVEDMKVPTALWSGDKDFLADLKDVANLKPRIPNLFYSKTIPGFSHLDFIVGINANHEVSQEILRFLNESK
ncbi:tear acid lipase [Sigmodon hispidus]